VTDVSNTAEAAALLAAYDDQLRGGSETADVPTSTDGPVIRVEYLNRGFVSYRSLDGLDGDELDGTDRSAARLLRREEPQSSGRPRGHDLPADLTDRLVAAGFQPEERQTTSPGVKGPA
jgi:hypothetical protein